MATPKQFKFTFKELAEIMVEKAGVQKGLWGLYVRFGIQAMNIGPSDAELKPAAVIPIMELGLQEFETANSLTVDAAEVQGKKPPKDSKRRSS